MLKGILGLSCLLHFLTQKAEGPPNFLGLDVHYVYNKL